MRWICGVVCACVCVTSAEALTISGRQAAVRTIGSPTVDAWGLWAIGEVGGFIDCAKGGRYRVIVEAFGRPAEKEWPAMTVLVDYEPVAPARVDNAALKTFSFTVPIDAGAHRITVNFPNGQSETVVTNRRTLFVKSISIVPDGQQPEPTLIDESRWRSTCEITLAKREAAALAEAESRIETFRKTNVMLSIQDASGQPIRGAKVTIAQTQQEFLFGSNLYKWRNCASPQANALYEQQFLGLMNYATIGFYWRSFEPSRGQVSYDYTDAAVDWCREHRVTTKGHPLLWNDEEAGIPTWSGNAQPAIADQKHRVTEIVRRYAGRIDRWEVVNEPAHFLNLPIDEPYRWARAANPKAMLIVNDYQVMADSYLPFYELLQQAITNNVPFDGIGIQAHEPRFARFSLPTIQRTLDRYASLGKPIHITEAIFGSGGQPMTFTPIRAVWNEQTQAEYVTQFYTMCFAHPAVVAITWWDLSDDGAWLPGSGLLRADMSPKPAYTALQALIRDKWMTRTSATSDEKGVASFRGFLGEYMIVVEHNGQRVEQMLPVVRNPKGVTGCTIVVK